MSKIGNNLDLNIPEYLSKKYTNWQKEVPEIYELDDDLRPVRIWKNKQEIKEFYHAKYIQAIDLAIRKSVRFNGSYFVIKVLYDELGLRPIITEKRNEAIYAYNPPRDILERYYNYEDFTFEDFYSNGVKENFDFISRFRNSVECANYLDLSITNIRQVAKKKLLLHKDYFFSFEPLMPIHKVEADIIDLSKRNNKYLLNDEEKQKLIDLITQFKQEYLIGERYRSDVEQRLYNAIIQANNNQEFIESLNQEEIEEDLDEI